MTKKECVVLVAERLVKKYGYNLMEGDADIQMAEAAVDALLNHLTISQDTRISAREYRKWKRSRRILPP